MKGIHAVLKLQNDLEALELSHHGERPPLPGSSVLPVYPAAAARVAADAERKPDPSSEAGQDAAMSSSGGRGDESSSFWLLPCVSADAEGNSFFCHKKVALGAGAGSGIGALSELIPATGLFMFMFCFVDRTMLFSSPVKLVNRVARRRSESKRGHDPAVAPKSFQRGLTLWGGCLRLSIDPWGRPLFVALFFLCLSRVGVQVRITRSAKDAHHMHVNVPLDEKRCRMTAFRFEHFSKIDPFASPPPFAKHFARSLLRQGVKFRETPGDYDFDFHCAPARQFVVSLDAGVEIEVTDGTRRIFPAGTVMLLEDTWGKVRRWDATRKRAPNLSTCYVVAISCTIHS